MIRKVSSNPSAASSTGKAYTDAAKTALEKLIQDSDKVIKESLDGRKWKHGVYKELVKNNFIYEYPVAAL